MWDIHYSKLPVTPQLLQALLDAGSDNRRQALRKPQLLIEH